MRMKELLYNFGCCGMFCDDSAISLPSWTVFQSDIVEDNFDQPSEVIINPIYMTATNWL